MISNLRARPIQGFVTDSAGNIIRNSNIVVYRNSSDGIVAVDRATSDDEGYFVSNPLPNGVYDIFESGIRTSRIIHNADPNAIQCFKASKANYFENDVAPFSSLVDIDSPDLNSYKYFLQIEPEDISVDVYGNMFPIYNKDLSVLEVKEEVRELYYLKTFFNLRTDSRITISRFDVEYYLPLTATQSSYRRIKWAGVPGIRFKKDSKLVVPLDYFSIVANMPFKISNNGDDFAASQVEIDYVFGSTNDLVVTLSGDSDNNAYKDVYNNVGIGDIIKVVMSTSRSWYGIIVGKSTYSMVLEKWKSSRFQSSGADPAVGEDVLLLKAYHGIFQSMATLSVTVSDYFSVVENLHQQTVDSELYDYSGGV